ncbi:cytochrome P450 [Mycena alexandri]|uniref:Cytochrome P450 n=1 Tax=Mycena alexandri TaxID=1745969 RepID=A0AAD6SYM2_9AGAR|nr:cytochrome P450 [Mycena alexandri]
MGYALTFAALLGVFFLFALRRKGSLRTIPGPISPSWIFGNLLELMVPPTYGEKEFAWQKIYGTVYRIRGCIGCSFVTSVGFTATAVSECQAALERIAKKFSEASDELEVNSGKSINVCPLLGSAALSAASELVFGIEELDNDLVGDIVKIMPRWPGQSKSEMLIDGIGARFPAFFRAATLYLRSFNSLRKVQAQATQVGRQILRERVAAIESRTVDYGHDLYTKLLADTSSSKRKLTDDEITEQTSVLLVAGHETTATTLAFGLLELGRNPEFQQNIRDELNARQGDVAYDSLPLLNAFIKEVLRMYPAAALRERVALKDEIIPLSEGIVTTTGQRITKIPIREGDQVVLALASYQSPFGEMMQTVSIPTAGLMAKYIKEKQLGHTRICSAFLVVHMFAPGGASQMQVILAELIRKFSFTIPAGNDIVFVKFSNTLQPTDSSGQKCLRLCVARNLEV